MPALNARRCLVIAAVCLLLTRWPARAEDDAPNARLMPPAPMHETVLIVPGDDSRPVMLQVTLYTPSGPGPFPLAVMNHGVSGSKQRPRDMARYRYTYSAYYFLSRGYAVALPMMRGYAGSGGIVADHVCDLAALGTESARDIRAVIAALAQQPQIDSSRIVVAGQSFGGWNALALGTLRPRNVRGLVNFSGGVRISTCGGASGRADESLVAAAGQFGARTSLPSLWFYGDNDSLFPAAVWRAMHRAYTQAGGHADLVAIGSFMDDSHTMLSYPESLPLWAPKVDAFLARIGLPSREIHPEYLPVPPPPPSHFAALDDVGAVPRLNEAGRDAYRRFLRLSLPRVFLIMPGGGSIAADGGFDPLGRALQICRDRHLGCRAYAVDNDVVWTPPPAPPPPSNYAPLGDAAAVPYIGAAARSGYQKFLSLPAPRAFVVSPDGAWTAAAGGFDPLGNALEACRRAHAACAAYAVDGVVVWRGAQPPLTIR